LEEKREDKGYTRREPRYGSFTRTQDPGRPRPPAPHDENG
jgi:hypothetical protein